MISKSAEKKTLLSWLTVLAVIAGVTLIRSRLLGIPLERDEGEYAYIAQLMIKGIPPYLTAYSMKLPGIFIAYAVNMLMFGQSVEGIHTGLIVVNAISVLLVFILAGRFLGPCYGAVAGASFAFLSIGGSVLGLTANAEHFLLLPMLAGMLLLVHALGSKRTGIFFISGLLFGCAFLVKQHGIFFIFFGALCILLHPFFAGRRLVWRGMAKQILSFVSGSAIPFIVTCLFFLTIGIFDKFWFWTFEYARIYAGYAPFFSAASSFLPPFKKIVTEAPLLWILAGAGCIGLLLDRGIRSTRAFFLGLLITSFIAISPGFYFRSHYFILALPAVSLCIAYGTKELASRIRISKNMRTAVLVLLFTVIAACSVYSQRSYLFCMGPVEASKRMYGADSVFPEAANVAKFIKHHSTGGQSVVVAGSEPEIYFYLDRPSPTGYICFFFLTEKHPYTQAMQKEFSEKVEAAAPDYLIFAPSWKSEFTSHEEWKRMLRWFVNYRESHYDLVGIADIISEKTTEYRWGNETKQYIPNLTSCILVYERKTPRPALRLDSAFPFENHDAHRRQGQR